MGRLDRYVAKTLLGAFLSTVVFLTVMFVGLDVVTRMEHYVAAGRAAGFSTFETLLEVAHYELLSIPFMFVRIAPFVTVIASMFALTRLMASNEIVPMLFVGRSASRVLRPMLVLGLLSAATMAATWQWVLPHYRADLSQARMFVRGKSEGSVLGNIAVRTSDATSGELFCQLYWTKPKRMENLIFYVRGATASEEEYVAAAAATWVPERSDWLLLRGRYSAAGGRDIEERDYLGIPGVTPALIVQSEMEKRDTMFLAYSELLELQQLRGARPDYVLALHSHITFPLSNVLLLMLVLPLALRFESSRRTVHVFAAILICALYLLFDLTCQNLVYRGALHPIIGAWSPTIVFGSLATVMFGSVRS
jgi:lipopolysaccharide export system permease protein